MATKVTAGLIKFKLPNIIGSVVRTLMSKLTENISVLDMGVIGDGRTDDTAAWGRMVEQLNARMLRAYIPAGCNVLLQAGAMLPKAGVVGASHMNSKITIRAGADANINTFGLVYGAVGEYADSYGGIEKVRITVEQDNSPITLLRINTVSRGAYMKDTTLHCGTGACVGVSDFYYYRFDNVVFEGKYIRDDLVNQGNPLRGRAFRQLDNKEINNIQFNKCDFRYLEDVIESAGTFVGSNSIGFYNCAFEKLGKGLGSLAGWWVDFVEGYIEKLGMNKSYAAGDATMMSCGAGNVTMTKVLLNLGSLPAGNPLINAVLNTVRLVDCAGTLPAGFTSTVLRQNTYSSRGRLILDNSPVFDTQREPCYTRLAQQHVGGYYGAGGDAVMPLYGTADAARNSMQSKLYSGIGTYSLPAREVGSIMLPAGGVFMVTIEGFITHSKEGETTTDSLKYSGCAKVNTNTQGVIQMQFIIQKQGTEFDNTWDTLYELKFEKASGGFVRYSIQWKEKTGRGYKRDVLDLASLRVVHLSGNDGTVGITTQS